MSSATVYALYGLFALGGAALFFLMPSGDRSRKALGVGLGVAAAVGFIALLASGQQASEGPRFFFSVFATIAIVAGVRVITHPKPVYSAIYFVLVVIATAALLVLQSAEFLAVALVIIYAGAILVTYLFVIMLAQQSATSLYDQNAREPLAGILVGFVLAAAIAGHASRLAPHSKKESRVTQTTEVVSPTAIADPPGNTLALGSILLTRYVVVLELAGLLLLISMVGAIALSRKRIASEAKWPGHLTSRIGREVEPF